MIRTSAPNDALRTKPHRPSGRRSILTIGYLLRMRIGGRCHRSTLGTRCLFVLSALLLLFSSQTPLRRSSTGSSSCTSGCFAAVGVVMADSSSGTAAGRIVKPYRQIDGDKEQQHSISSASSSSSSTNEGILKSQEHFIRVQYCTSWGMQRNFLELYVKNWEFSHDYCLILFFYFFILTNPFDINFFLNVYYLLFCITYTLFLCY